MVIPSAVSVHPFGLLLTRDARAQGWAGALQGAARRGELVKVRPGAYLPAGGWAALTPPQRSLARIHAAALTLGSAVFALRSAAVIHGLPLIGEQRRVHVLQQTPGGSGTRVDTTVHAYSGDPDIVQRDGLRATSPARTVLDLARVLPHHEALMVADAALRPTGGRSRWTGTGAALCTKTDLLERARPLIGLRGGWNAYRVVQEADPRADSAGESFGRSVMMRLGAPMPQLQVPIYDGAGLIGYADYFWREYGVIGEFDGALKYGADNPSGKSPERVVYDEKLREDRMRRACRAFVRFGWRDLQEPTRLARLLVATGLPLDPGAWSDLRAAARAASRA